MATHSSILAWETPWTEEPGRLQNMGLQRVGHNLETKQQLPFTRSRFCPQPRRVSEYGAGTAIWQLTGVPYCDRLLDFQGFVSFICKRKSLN